MKKITLIIGLILWSLFLGGCIKQEEKTSIESISNTGVIDNNIVQSGKNQDISLHGVVASGMNIPNYSIYISGNMLIYNNIFSINIPQKGLSQRDFRNQYGDILDINDGDLNGLQISKYTLSQNSKCDYNFDEGVRSIVKKTKLINGINIKLANILFHITSPDITPTNSRQSFLCFTKEESVYKITISDDTKFRTDIINSFKFLQ